MLALKIGKAEKVKFEFEGVDLADGGPSEH